MAGGTGKKAFAGSAELVFQNGPSGDLYYFAYGSNMNREQMLARCGNPKLVGIAKLSDHQLGFFGCSAIWDGGEESVIPAPGQEMWGVLYELNESDRERLDDAQDALFDGSGSYFHSPVSVIDQEGKADTVLIYKKANLGDAQKPSQEYLNFIVQGAADHGLPSDYVEKLRGLESRKAGFVVPRKRKSARETVGGSCSDCGDDFKDVISINLNPS
jgi:gamma-glutamylcyclotransferase